MQRQGASGALLLARINVVRDGKMLADVHGVSGDEAGRRTTAGDKRRTSPRGMRVCQALLLPSLRCIRSSL